MKLVLLILLFIIHTLSFCGQQKLLIMETEVGSSVEYGLDFFKGEHHVLYKKGLFDRHRECERASQSDHPRYRPHRDTITFRSQDKNYSIVSSGKVEQDDKRFIKNFFNLIVDNKDTIGAFNVVHNRAKHPVNGIAIHDGKLIIETVDNFIVNDIDFCKKHGFDKVFNYRILGGKSFFFFEENGVVKINYNSDTLMYSYDFVHHNSCCYPASFNPQNYKDHINFYARRGDMWYLVKVELTEES